MKIIQITACALPECYKNPTIVFGLGDDGLIYCWDDRDAKWVLNQDKQG